MANMFLLKRSEIYFIKLIGLLTGVVLLANINLASGSTYTQENYFEEDKFTPNFLTLGQKYSIPIGSTVVLPCKINKTVNTGHYSLVWKRDIAVLTAEKVIVTVNPRIRLMSNIDTSESSNYETKSYNLEIREVRTTDAGEYACQIGTMVPKEIIHTLEILVPPKIEYMNPSSRLDINQGAAIRIECRASGNPLPKIIWTRKNNIMFNGEPNITKDVLEILHANRHSTGLYKCSADNRVGQTDSREIFVNVLHPPEIEVERPYVHTGVGYEAQLVCIVHAEPPPNIVWFKDDIQLGTTEIYSQQSRGNRYSLIIRNVTFTDFGNYTCQANNNLGKEKALVKLTGIPSICVFDSPTLGDYRDQYNISWSVITYSPIREYRLFYVKQNTHNLIQDNSVNQGYGGSSSSSSSMSSSSNGNQISFDQWENIIIQGKTGNDYSSGGSSNILSNSINHFHYVPQFSHHHSKQHMYYMMKNLTPSTNYIVRIQARNEHGWNKISGIFHFSTRAEDLEMEPSAQPAVSKNIENIGSHAYSFAPKQFVFESTNLKYFLYFIYFINIFRILS